jgi:hypothetical protein
VASTALGVARSIPSQDEARIFSIGRLDGGNGALSLPRTRLDPAVLMMKSAEDRLSSELAEPLDRPMARRILTKVRCVRSSL